MYIQTWMYVHVFVCTFVFMYEYVYIYIYMYVRMYVLMSMRMYVFFFWCAHVHPHVQKYVLKFLLCLPNTIFFMYLIRHTEYMHSTHNKKRTKFANILPVKFTEFPLFRCVGSHYTAFPCVGCSQCGSHTDQYWDIKVRIT